MQFGSSLKRTNSEISSNTHPSFIHQKQKKTRKEEEEQEQQHTSQGTGGISDVNNLTVYDFFDESIPPLTGCFRT